MVLDADGQEWEFDQSFVTSRKQDVSAMPTGLEENLSLRELRDLVAFLASLGG